MIEQEMEHKEEVVDGKVESSILIKEEQCPDHKHCSIYHCSIADFHNYVEANSLDAIITDPPYPREFLPVYTDLAKFAIHALKPGGSLITMVGQSYLPDVMDMLREYLTYHWMACYYVPGETTKLWHRNIGASWKPLLWFVKGKYAGPWVKDVVREDVFIGKKKDKQHHQWGQPVNDIAAIIEHFTLPGQLICDPFLGGGTTAIAAMTLSDPRKFIGCDIDENAIKTAHARIKQVKTVV